MDKITIHKNNKTLKGDIYLSGSKSLSNRVLIIQALCNEDFTIDHLSDSDDTVTLHRLLTSGDEVLDAHHAGTTFRFLTAFHGVSDREITLTGSDRMLQRPIGPLVDALRHVGADIEYLGEEGYPPLRIKAFQGQKNKSVSIDASVSSQYISALMMIAPTLPNGLTIELTGDIVSKSYYQMTLKTMEYFGIQYEETENKYHIAPQKYVAKDFFVEGDWSAASYYYIMGAFAEEVDLTLHGLMENSLQGDKAIVDISEKFGLETTFDHNTITIKKTGTIAPFFEYDFINCPDIAQSVCVMCAGTGVNGLFTGLQTLSIKETDRIEALKTELAKTHVFLAKLPEKFSKKSGITYYSIEGKSTFPEGLTFPTYDDHRMAMAFAPLSLLGEITIEDPKVVSKSYPKFWDDFESLFG